MDCIMYEGVFKHVKCLKLPEKVVGSLEGCKSLDTAKIM